MRQPRLSTKNPCASYSARLLHPLAGSSLDDPDAIELERLLRSVADRHRLKILNMLARARAPVCVCEFTAKLELPQQNASYHLKQLVDAGVIVRERRGGGDRDRRPERDGGAALP